MSRVAGRAEQIAVSGTLYDAFTVPDGHKYELTDIAIATNALAGSGYLLLQPTGGGGPRFLDQVDWAAGRYGEHRSYTLMSFFAGEKCQVLYIGGTGALAVFEVYYIDVSPQP